MKGPAIFLAQFVGTAPGLDTLDGLLRWAAELGYDGVQIPADPRLIDLEALAHSQASADRLTAQVQGYGLRISELSTHLQGQLLAVHPAYDTLFDGFAPPSLRGRPLARQQWAKGQLLEAAQASRRLGLDAHATFSGSLAWPYLYPWPQRPPGLVEAAFSELASRWRPILDAFDQAGVDLCFELHPGEDLHDGTTFERFLAGVDQHPRACILYDPSHMLLQHMDYLGFIDLFHQRIRAFHVKDAEFRASARQGVYGGYAPWQARAGRFRSVGDGQVDFKGIFSRLIQYGYSGWAVLEWECCLKAGAQGAREGAPFIRGQIFDAASAAFDDFAATPLSASVIQQLLGLPAGGAQ